MDTRLHMDHLKELRQETSWQYIPDIRKLQTGTGKKGSDHLSCCFSLSQSNHPSPATATEASAQISLNKIVKPSLYQKILYLRLIQLTSGSLPSLHLYGPSFFCVCVFWSTLQRLSPSCLQTLLHSTQGSRHRLRQQFTNFNTPAIYFQQWQFRCRQDRTSPQSKPQGSK